MSEKDEKHNLFPSAFRNPQRFVLKSVSGCYFYAFEASVNHLENTSCEVSLGFNDPLVQVYSHFSVNRKGEVADGCRESGSGSR